MIGTVNQLSETIKNMNENNESTNSDANSNQKNHVKVTQHQVHRIKTNKIDDEAIAKEAKISKAGTVAIHSQSSTVKDQAEGKIDEVQSKNAYLNKFKTLRVEADDNKIPSEQIKNINKIISNEIGQIMNESNSINHNLNEE